MYTDDLQNMKNKIYCDSKHLKKKKKKFKWKTL